MINSTACFFQIVWYVLSPSLLFSALAVKAGCNKLHPDIRVTYINQEIINGSSYSIMLGIDSLFILIEKNKFKSMECFSKISFLIFSNPDKYRMFL